MTNKHAELERKDFTRSRGWFFVSILLALSLAGISLHAYVNWNHEASHYTDESSKYPLIDPARHLIPQEHFLSTLQPLRERLRELVAGEKDLKMSVYIEFLNTGANISINQDVRYWPASLSKVPIAIAAMGTVQSGIWSLDQQLTLEDSDRVEQSSNLSGLPTGTRFTVRELLEELLMRSDNTAYRILLRNVPVSQIDGIKEALGLDELFNEKGQVTAKEYSRIFRSLYTASYLNRENSQLILTILDRAEFNEFLSKDMPETIPFPHKYGLFPEARVYNDAGIVYVDNRPYIISVFIEGTGVASEKEDVQDMMRAISNMTRQYMSSAQNTEVKASPTL